MQHAHVLLCEDDKALVSTLADFFADEGIDLTVCNSIEEVDRALDLYPGAVVMTDSWSRNSYDHIDAVDRDKLLRLSARTSLIVTTGRPWGAQLAELGQGDALVFVPKPYSLDDLLSAVRVAAAAGRSNKN